MTKTGTFQPGDRVRLISTGECGVIVHAWKLPELPLFTEYYVAFFGKRFPANGMKPEEKPYVLRYAETSLRRARRASPRRPAPAARARRSRSRARRS